MPHKGQIQVHTATMSLDDTTRHCSSNYAPRRSTLFPAVCWAADRLLQPELIVPLLPHIRDKVIPDLCQIRVIAGEFCAQHVFFLHRSKCDSEDEQQPHDKAIPRPK